jgi:hypothetical protein
MGRDRTGALRYLSPERGDLKLLSYAGEIAD